MNEPADDVDADRSKRFSIRFKRHSGEAICQPIKTMEKTCSSGEITGFYVYIFLLWVFREIKNKKNRGLTVSR
jgi:hypothetical protein